jgi:LuxR family maltose regulon positive regulatory protein
MSDLVRRPALMQLMDEATSHQVTVVAAPAGSGKTLLIRSWLEERQLMDRAAWVSVRRGERDDQRFWTSVVDALRAAASNEATIEPLAPTPDFDGEALVERLLSRLSALETNVILAVDDLHELASPTALTQLEAFLNQLPSAVRVVLATRRDLHLGLHRQRVDRQLAEVRTAHLRFTLEETRELLGTAGTVLSEAKLALLHERTEGWAAGLRLAALSLIGHPEPERFVAEFSGSERTVADYLLAEVLLRQPDDIRTLLLRTSVLERVSGALGDALTGGTGAEGALQALEASGAFVVALDPARTWFRYHHLFADLLALELRRTEPNEILRLHRVAAGWYAEHGHVVDAIAHAQAAGDWQWAVGLLADHFFSLTLDGRRATAHAMLADFAADAVAADPEFAVVVAADQLAEGSLEDAAAYLALAERVADLVREDRRSRFELSLTMVKLALARQRGDFESVLDQAELRGGVAEARDAREIAFYGDVRALALMNLGIVEAWSGRPEGAARHLIEARELARQIERPHIEVSCLAQFAYALRWQSFTAAQTASREALGLAERYGWGEDPVIASALVTLAVTALQSGRLDEADEWLDRADRTLRARVEPAMGCLMQMVRGVALVVRGQVEEGIARFLEAERLEVLLATSPPIALQLRALILDARLRLGETSAVRAALQDMGDAEREWGEMRVMRASLALAEGAPQAVVDVLAPILDRAAPVHHVGVVVRALVLEALARDDLGDARASEDALERALDLAAPHALVISFLFDGPCRGLLARHPRHRTAHGAFLNEIVGILAGSSPRSLRTDDRPPLDALSQAELRVLRLLPSNLPVSEIAAELHLSLNTVKTHMRHIYMKFAAHTRSEVVDRAREHGLLGPSGRN